MHYDPLDYSPHMIKADQGLGRVRSLLLKREFDQAMEIVDEIIAELRLAKAAIKDTKEHS